jgi:SpoVK/Ycf46/Vps4 family AAA+-type ATPase
MAGQLTDGIFAVQHPETRLADMVLAEPLSRQLHQVVLEQRQRERLREYGLEPSRKLLLVGPPGTGKTMTASALARELEVPLFAIQLDGVITQYLGETASKLRKIFDAIRSTRGVYLFDEFDALGGARDSTSDIGEIRRALNSLLQFLEHDDSDSVIVCATNHVGLLDRALFRRFDAMFEYDLPTTQAALGFMRARLAALNTTGIYWADIAWCVDDLSYADLQQACSHAAKHALLEDRCIDTGDLRSALGERPAGPMRPRPSRGVVRACERDREKEGA